MDANMCYRRPECNLYICVLSSLLGEVWPAGLQPCFVNFDMTGLLSDSRAVLTTKKRGPTRLAYSERDFARNQMRLAGGKSLSHLLPKCVLVKA